MDTDDMYKYMIYTILQNNFSILSTQKIANVGAKITTNNEQFFKHHKAGALKLSTFFLDKQLPIKQRAENTFMVDFVWHHGKNKGGFKTYTYKMLSDKMSEYTVCFPMMSTRELVDWAKACYSNVSIHAYDATYSKFMKHLGTSRDISLLYFVKEHHYYPITDERLKTIATKANQGGIDNLWKHMSDMKWSRRHEQCVVLNDLGEEEELDVSGQVIVLPEDVKIEPVIDRYILRTNYFVESHILTIMED